MAIGMAVNSGSTKEKQELSDLLRQAAKIAFDLQLWVEGKPFDITLGQIVDQLKTDEEPANVYSRHPHRSA